MNKIIIEWIVKLGLVNDWDLSVADVRELNDYIHNNKYDEWLEYHGDDENGEETDYHLIQKDGAKTRMFEKNAINNVFDGIYYLGFETNGKNRLLNEDWNNNKGFKKVTPWISTLLEEDIDNWSLKNSDVDNVVVWDTETGLDQIIDIINTDTRLDKRIFTRDIVEWARASNEMNHIVIKSIKETWVASDGNIPANDVKEINKYIVENHKEEWAVLHGDDEDGEETGFHLVQNDWAKTKLFEKNAINKVADGIYHLGFETNNKRRLLSEKSSKTSF